jgi:hypothetical protein
MTLLIEMCSRTLMIRIDELIVEKYQYCILGIRHISIQNLLRRISNLLGKLYRRTLVRWIITNTLLKLKIG